MTVKELIVELLECPMDDDVLLVDNTEFVDEHRLKCSGSCYQIETIEKCGQTELHFNNRNHFAENKTVERYTDKIKEQLANKLYKSPGMRYTQYQRGYNDALLECVDMLENLLTERDVSKED